MAQARAVAPMAMDKELLHRLDRPWQCFCCRFVYLVILSRRVGRLRVGRGQRVRRARVRHGHRHRPPVPRPPQRLPSSFAPKLSRLHLQTPLRVRGRETRVRVCRRQPVWTRKGVATAGERPRAAGRGRRTDRLPSPVPVFERGSGKCCRLVESHTQTSRMKSGMRRDSTQPSCRRRPMWKRWTRPRRLAQRRRRRTVTVSP